LSEFALTGIYMASVKVRDVKRLFSLSGNRCAFPKCECAIAESGSLVGEICHIKADRPDGPRYDKTQTEDERQGFDNLILMCANHHKVVDDDTDAYTVERLRSMKLAHESNVRPLPETSESSKVVDLLIDQSVTSSSQSGGLAAHTINANTINVHGAGPDSTRTIKTTQAIEALWQTLVKLKSEFNDIIFTDIILLSSELNACFAGQSTNTVFEAIGSYENNMVVVQKMQRILLPNAETHRLFVSQRIWALYEVLVALYGRSAMLLTLSFKDHKFRDWRNDDLLDQHLRSVLPSAQIDKQKQSQTGGLSGLVILLEAAFLEETRRATPH